MFLSSGVNWRGLPCSGEQYVSWDGSVTHSSLSRVTLGSCSHSLYQTSLCSLFDASEADFRPLEVSDRMPVVLTS